jgi:hypothetical protein
MSASVHPDRVALLAGDQQPGSNTTTHLPTENGTPSLQSGTVARPLNCGPLPPDVEAARKARINREMIELFRLPAKGAASIHGIGLYTHAAAPQSTDASKQTPAPVFLPVGGHNRVLKDVGEIDAPIDEDVRRVWEDLREAVNEEERHVGRGDMSAEKLKERYGAIGVPEGSTEPAQNLHIQQQLEQAFEYLRRLKQATALSRDVAMGGTDEDGTSRTNPVAASTNPAPRGNEYHEERDPRKR